MSVSQSQPTIQPFTFFVISFMYSFMPVTPVVCFDDIDL